MAEDTNKQWKTPGSSNESPKHPPMVDGIAGCGHGNLSVRLQCQPKKIRLYHGITKGSWWLIEPLKGLI